MICRMMCSICILSWWKENEHDGKWAKYENEEQEIRNKAIDEFAEVVGINIIDIFVSDSERNMAYGILKTTAENLKGERNE